MLAWCVSVPRVSVRVRQCGLGLRRRGSTHCRRRGACPRTEQASRASYQLFHDDAASLPWPDWGIRRRRCSSVCGRSSLRTGCSERTRRSAFSRPDRATGGRSSSTDARSTRPRYRRSPWGKHCCLRLSMAAGAAAGLDAGACLNLVGGGALFDVGVVTLTFAGPLAPRSADGNARADSEASGGEGGPAASSPPVAPRRATPRTMLTNPLRAASPSFSSASPVAAERASNVHDTWNLQFGSPRPVRNFLPLLTAAEGRHLCAFCGMSPRSSRRSTSGDEPLAAPTLDRM